MRWSACESAAGFGADWAKAGDAVSASAPARTTTLICDSLLLSGLAAAPFFEQPRGVAGHGMQRRRPAERAGARTSDDLIERERVGVRTHLLARLRQRHVPDARLRLRVARQRVHDLVDRLGPAVGRVVDARRLRRAGQPRVELAEIAIVDERPVVVAAADDADE